MSFLLLLGLLKIEVIPLVLKKKPFIVSGGD